MCLSIWTGMRQWICRELAENRLHFDDPSACPSSRPNVVSHGLQAWCGISVDPQSHLLRPSACRSRSLVRTMKVLMRDQKDSRGNLWARNWKRVKSPVFGQFNALLLPADSELSLRTAWQADTRQHTRPSPIPERFLLESLSSRRRQKSLSSQGLDGATSPGPGKVARPCSMYIYPHPQSLLCSWLKPPGPAVN